MLVLKRKVEERVVISVPGHLTASGDPIEIRVLVCLVKLRDMSVRLGFEADRDVEIHRLEVWEDIQRDNQEVCNGNRVGDSSTDTGPDAQDSGVGAAEAL